MIDSNVRVFFPVGMGGFSFEKMDGTTVVYDCGSTSITVIKNSIFDLEKTFFDDSTRPVIDHLFISHFDSDHINGIGELLKKFEVKEMHLPYVDYKYRPIMSLLTDNGPIKLYNLLIHSNINSRISLCPTNKQKGFSIKSKNKKWEWVITNLLNESFFDEAKSMLERCGVAFDELDNCQEELIMYGVEPYKISIDKKNFPDEEIPHDASMVIYSQSVETDSPDGDTAKKLLTESLQSFECKKINDILHDANNGIADILKDIEEKKAYAKNEYGMLMLSKHIEKAETGVLSFKNQIIPLWYYDDYIFTSCLYTGDMNMARNGDLSTILMLQDYNKEPLQFFQIPHHGSPHNSGLKLLNYVNTVLYFCYDTNNRRLLQNIGNSFILRRFVHYPLIMLIDRDSEMDELVEIP